jgi:Uma2 family endonuclease
MPRLNLLTLQFPHDLFGVTMGIGKKELQEFYEMPATLAAPKRPEVIVQGQIVIPRWVEDLASFRRWRLTEDAPDTGEIAFLDSYIWVDLTMEEFLTHNQVKAAYDYAIMNVVNPASLGRYVPDRMLLTNTEANLNAEPDGLFFSWEAMRSGRLRLVEREGQGIMELEGTPDQVLEVVSKTSVRKDTIMLRDLYWKARIPEYWLVDVRDGVLSFEILQWTPEGYVAGPVVEGWIASKVFGRKFQLQKKVDPLGHPQFVVLVDDSAIGGPP